MRAVFTTQPVASKQYDVDYFISWFFVMSDELWNLMPMDSSLNSSKSNRLPKGNPSINLQSAKNMKFGMLEIIDRKRNDNMNTATPREQVLSFIKNEYDIAPDHPWDKYPKNEVFRHKDTGKWFGIIIPIGKEKVGLSGEGDVELLNVKLDPAMIDLLRGKEGFLPAYHMNKISWISIRLDGSVQNDMIFNLVAQSYLATASKKVKQAFEMG